VPPEGGTGREDFWCRGQAFAFVAAPRVPDASSERMYTRPPWSSATMRCSSANVQQVAGASQWNVAMTRPVSGAHTFRVLSQDAETARFPSPVTATP
jgi:hypothetical protein